MELKIKPCPFCGNDLPFEYISIWTVYIHCRCGIQLKDSGARVLYKKGDCPKELIGVQTYEATALIMKIDGKEVKYPEHNYVGVSALVALQAYGHLERWNKRIDNASQ